MDNVAKQLKEGKIGVIPSDTLYGLMGSAMLPDTVERIYRTRSRDTRKAMIVLISCIEDLKSFDIKLGTESYELIANYWPGKISFVLPCTNEKFAYLHRGTGAIAFRVPESEWLQELLSKSGPLVAPSANPEGKEPAKTISEAEAYFGNSVDFYLDQGKLEGELSTVVKLSDGKLEVLRQGAVKVFNN
jgi:L-threonylcarbamoyladenylate synthase